MFGLSFRELLPNWAQQELDQLVAKIKGYLLIQHDELGGHTDVTADSLDVFGDVDAGGHGEFGEDVIAQLGTGVEVGIGALTTVNGTSLLPGEVVRQGVLIGGTSGWFIQRRATAASPFTSGQELLIWSLGFSTTAPVARLGLFDGVPTLLDGGTGSAGLRVGVAGSTDNASVTGSAVTTESTLVASSVLSPAQITADQNDYAPTGHATAFAFLLTSDAARNITGLAGGVEGRLIHIHNDGAQNIVLVAGSVASTAANRFVCPGGVDFTLNGDDSVMLQYLSSRWRVIAA